MYWEFVQKLAQKCFKACELKAIFKCSSIISTFAKVPEIFWNIFRANFQRFKFSVYFRFSLHFFQNIWSVKVHELGSWSLYSNIRRSTNPYSEEWPSTNQNLILSIQHIIKFDLIKFRSVLLSTSHLTIRSHQSPPIKLIYFMVSVKWLYFNRRSITTRNSIINKRSTVFPLFSPLPLSLPPPPLPPPIWVKWVCWSH